LRVKADVIYYKKDVPLKPIVDHLREKESTILRAQASGIEKDSIILKGDVVTLEDIAKEKGVSLEAVGLALQGFRPSGYARVGNSSSPRGSSGSWTRGRTRSRNSPRRLR